MHEAQVQLLYFSEGIALRVHRLLLYHRNDINNVEFSLTIVPWCVSEPVLCRPQFSVQKRCAPYSRFTVNTISRANTKTISCNKIINPNHTVGDTIGSAIHPITIVSSAGNVTASGSLYPLCKVPPTVVNRAFTSTCKPLQRSSPSPSVVTLSGVNKTAGGIIKSPSVLNGNRKQTFNINTNNNILTINNSNISNSNNNNITLVTNSSVGNGVLSGHSIVATSSAGDLHCSSNTATQRHDRQGLNTNNINSSGSTPVYKTVTVSNTGRLTTSTGKHIILAKRPVGSAKLKDSPKGSLFIPINSKDIEKVSQWHDRQPMEPKICFCSM